MTIIEIQEALKLCNYSLGLADGIYDEKTKKAVIQFQTDYSLTKDGIAGIETKSKLLEQISQIQTQLNKKGYPCAIDGIVGTATKNAIMMIQKNYDLCIDGIIGMNTASVLFDDISLSENFNPNEQVTEHFNMNEFISNVAVSTVTVFRFL